MYGKGLRTLSLLTVASLAIGFGLAFFWAPLDADQGFIQKIFYVHVPLAIVALAGFVWAGWHGFRHLRTDRPEHDARSYVYIHQAVILGVAVLVTGSIWARASWGAWWVWEEPTLVSFLLVFLIYATYFPLRYSIADRRRQARYASVFAVVAGAFVPMNFLAVRLSESLVHPRVFTSAGASLPPRMALTFAVCLVAVALLYVTLVRFELVAKSVRGQLAGLRRTLAAGTGNSEALAGTARASRVAPTPRGTEAG